MKTKHPLFFLLFLFSLMIYGSCQTTTREKASDMEAQELSDAQAFFAEMKVLCNNSFHAEFTLFENGKVQEEKTVELIISDCDDEANEVRIKTELNDGLTRFIVLSYIADELLLKHDIRNADLTPHEHNMYGGFAPDSGTPKKQVFVFHNFGSKMWPGLENYSWEIHIDSENHHFIYTEKKENQILKQIIANTAKAGV